MNCEECEVPVCEKCGGPVPTGALVLSLCTFQEKCHLCPEDEESREFIRAIRPEVKAYIKL